MRKASKIIYLVAGIVSIVAAVAYLVWGIVLVVLPNTDGFHEIAQEIIKQNPDIPDFTEDIVKGIFIACGVCCLIACACAGVNSFLGFKAHKEDHPTRALQVLNIVFGVLSGVEVNIAGSIFSFIADGQESRRAIENKE